MKLIAVTVVVLGCLAATSATAAETAGGLNCRNPVTAGVGEEPIYVYLEAVSNGQVDNSIGFALKHFKARGHALAGWARSGCWTTNLFPRKRVPRTLCITARYGFRSLLEGGECQQWRMQAGRRVMVFRLIHQ